jgi:hypothetical protein
MYMHYAPQVEDLEQWRYDEGLDDEDLTPYEAGYRNIRSTMRVRGYQWEGINKMVRFKRFGNRDRPGMGKTMQAAFAAAIAGNMSDATAGKGVKILIVCPSYLTGTWADWLRGTDSKSLRRNNGVVIPNVPGRIRRVHGKREDRERALRSNKWDWYIVNQEMFDGYRDLLIELQATKGKPAKFQTVIVDESHHFRNHIANRTKTMEIVGVRAERIWPMSATMLWKEADDLYMPFRLIAPDEFKSYRNFLDLYCIADETRFGPKVLGVKPEMTAHLKQLLSLMTIGRTYKEVGRQLPQVLDDYIQIDFPPELEQAYQDLCDYWRTEFLDFHVENFSQFLNATRQMTFFPGKIDAIKDKIEEHAQMGHKQVVFTWFADHSEEAADRLKEYNAIPITGSLFPDPEIRKKVALDPANKIICATIASLSEGIDLSEARAVYFLEEAWTPGGNDQALSRIQRERIYDDDGAPIMVYYAHVKGTIDVAIHERSVARAGVQEALGLKEMIFKYLRI